MTTTEARRTPNDQGGFTLIEVITASLIAVIAVTGLAFTFGAGRGLVDRYAVARDGLAAAQQRMERLSIMGLKDPGNADLAPGLHGPLPRPLDGNMSGTEEWFVAWVDDPADNTGGGDSNPQDYKQVTVDVRWRSGAVQDSIRLSRIILGY
jgi:prepilin-type N-terminal cleavage/methylation domain-containing protein